MQSDAASPLGSQTGSVLSEAKERYVLTPYRFVIAIIFVIAANQNILMWSVFGPLQSTLQTIYGESLTWINFGTILISNVSYIPANFLGNYILEKYGLRAGILTGSVFGLIGLWIRFFSYHGFTWIFIGQCFAGMAQPYFYTTPQKISNTWFGVSERSYSTTFMSCCLLVGNCIGPIIPQWFITNGADNDTIKHQIQKMMFYAAIMGSVCFVFTVLLMKEKPAVAPSKAASAPKHDFKESLKTLLKDRNAMLMITTTAIINGTLVNYGSTFQQTVMPFGIDSTESGNIMSMSTGIGLVGSAIGAYAIHKTRKYNMVIFSSCVGSFIVLIWNLFAAETGNYTHFCIAMIMYQVVIAPLLPISLEYGVELAFPVGEATIGGMWFLVNQLSSTIESLIIDSVLGDSPTKSEGRLVFIIMIGYQAVAMIPLFFIKENLKRVKYEKGGQLLPKKIQDSEISQETEKPIAKYKGDYMA